MRRRSILTFARIAEGGLEVTDIMNGKIKVKMGMAADVDVRTEATEMRIEFMVGHDFIQV